MTGVALAALAGCILALTGYVLRAGRVAPRRAYELALEAERTPAAGAGSGVPGALHGSRWTWARNTAVALATFRTEVHRGVGHMGDTFPVAHTPGRPELGAVGAKARSEVEAQLIGRTLPHSSFLVVAAPWVILAMAMLFAGTAIAAPPRRARRVDASWVALRATATGVAEHVEQPSGDGPACCSGMILLFAAPAAETRAAPAEVQAGGGPAA
ncbi:hypothetical protein ACFW1M_04380 [Streptomyces inhibens]|uniref:hypothetical protein n=1 Tax=Streptomyces inhibens TaxID=2293571 RepID=UPI0036B46D1B